MASRPVSRRPRSPDLSSVSPPLCAKPTIEGKSDPDQDLAAIKSHLDASLAELLEKRIQILRSLHEKKATTGPSDYNRVNLEVHQF